MQEINLAAITIDEIKLPVLKEKNIEADILRLDKIHPLVSGNKWFKLEYYLQEAEKLKKKNIVTAGGAWSNHILATAASCKLKGWKSTGLIRGEQPAELSPTLQDAHELGMDIVFTGRSESYHDSVPKAWDGPEYYFIPRGGYGEKGASGAADILRYSGDKKYSHILCAVGTGTMIAGLQHSCPSTTQLTGISVLRNNFSVEDEIKRLCITEKPLPGIIHDYHFGGYAKTSPELFEFMNGFYSQTGIPTDFVYTAKLCFGFRHLCRGGFFANGSRILVIHSGGLNGNLSLKKGTLIF